MLRINRQNHSQEIVDSIKKMRHSNHMTDIILMAEGKTVKVHRFVLVTFSKYFKNLFDSMNFNESTQFVVVMKDIPMKHIETLVDFMYDGEIKVKKCEWMQLMQSAQALGINGIQSIVYKTNQHQPRQPSDDIYIDDEQPPLQQQHETKAESNNCDKRKEIVVNNKKRSVQSARVEPKNRKVVLRKTAFKATRKQPEINNNDDEEELKRKRRRRMKVEEFKSLHQCPVCHKCFSTATIMRNHVSAEHLNKRFECNICGEKIKWQPKFSLHMKQHRQKDGATISLGE